MKAIDYLYLVLVPTLLAVGQFLFKRTADGLVTHSVFRFFGSMLASPHFWVALLIYAIATFLWVFILSRVPLSRAIPFIALTFVIVPIISAVFFEERLNLAYWVGIFVVMGGVYITVRALSSP